MAVAVSPDPGIPALFRRRRADTARPDTFCVFRVHAMTAKIIRNVVADIVKLIPLVFFPALILRLPSTMIN